MKTGKGQYRSLLSGNNGEEKKRKENAVNREKYFEYELTRLARMVSSQRQIYISLKENQLGSIPGEIAEMDPFWTDLVDLENSYRADQRALQVLFIQAKSEGVYIKDWLRQLVVKSLSDSPERRKTKEKLVEILSVFKMREIEGSRNKKKTSEVESFDVGDKDVNQIIQKKLAFAKRYSAILESFIKTR